MGQDKELHLSHSASERRRMDALAHISRAQAARDCADDLRFLQGGGESGALMRAYDWASSSLGDPSGWPHSLRTLSEVILGADQPMSIIWGAERTLLYNDRYAEILMRKHPAAMGRPFAEVWQEIWHDVQPLMDRAFAGEPVNVQAMSLLMERNGQPEEAHFSFSYTPLRNSTGTVVGLFCPCLEITEAVRSRAILTAEKERLGELFRQAPGFMCVLDGPDHVFRIINDSYLQLVGHRPDIIGKSVREALPEVEEQGFLDLLDGVYSTGQPFRGHAVPVRLQRKPESPVEERFIDLLYQPITAGDGRVTGIFVEGNDVTQRIAAEQQQALIMGELNHRVANLFAVVSGMVAVTARSASTPQEMSDTLRGRLNALSRSHNLIRPGLDGTKEGGREETTMDALLRAVLLPYTDGKLVQAHQFITLTGPSILIGGDAVTSLALVFHETATNSAKYGALSTPEGSLRIEWAVQGGDLHLTWEERGGPIIVEPPKAEGFGSKLVMRSVSGSLQGRLEHDWRPEGLALRATIPLERLTR